ncbi:hypothetical protein L798_06264 [Zootermopsis nevadensis]|uniref:Chitin-binding type-2 domain-containing protein n=1 Tax=Zootermopsis nevadensis TaxID=136037 RepID=A0A067RG92_ZOONE|nr:hypothetical protein L798_06264 [Zootermopsis nevadensis]
MWTQKFVTFSFILTLYMATASSQDAGFKCKAAGFFADPTDCHRFYNCDDDLDAISGTCTAYAHFDPVDTCVWGDCTNPVIITPSPAAQFKCTTSGYFADPNNCRGFYQCSLALVATHGICMGGVGFFNNETLGCEMGTC